MESTTESASMSTETKEGVHIKGKDVIFLDAPEVLLSKDTPLLTDAQDVAGAINELFSYGAGGGDDWQPPGWWIPVPEPNDYDIYMLIKATDGVYDGMKASFGLYKQIQSGGWVYGNDAYCDWGDGTEEIYPSAAWTHTYEEPGIYLVHIIGNENAFAFAHLMKRNLLIFKSGKKIECNKFSGGFTNQSYLSYVKINNSGGLNLNGDMPGQVFQGCSSLKKISINSEPTIIYLRAFEVCRGLEQINFPNCKTIGELSFQGCSSIKTISFPGVTSIGKSTFSNCYRLQSIYLPNCQFIGETAFDNCNNLQEIVVAEDCTFGTNCFRNCYSLYPRPDGSVN